jgi:tRNA 2-thiouridine synthesizing protein A
MTKPADQAPGTSVEVDQILDTSDLRCPMPLLKTKLALNNLAVGAKLLVVATDAGSARDIPAFLKHTAHKLVRMEELDETFRFLIERG